MTIAGELGVESRLLEHLPEAGTVTAQFCISFGASLLEEKPLDVIVRARVYHLQEVQALGAVPERPLAEGPEVFETADPEYRTVELALPGVDQGTYAVVAKVVSRDARYPREFNPSHCFAGIVTYGIQRAQMRMEDLEAVYHGINNPLAEAEIRSQVRRGLITVRGPAGALYRPIDEGGQLRFELVQPPPQPPTAVQFRNWTGHAFWVMTPGGPVLDVPQEQRRFYISADGTLLTLDHPGASARPFSAADLPPPEPGVIHVVPPEVVARLASRGDLWDGRPQSAAG